MDTTEITAVVEAILFASGEPVDTARIGLILGVSEEEIGRAAEALAARYTQPDCGIRLLRLENKLQLCSAPAYSELVTRALEQRKPPKLSPAALEVLAIVAYFQPVTRAYIDTVRGVDSAYTVGVLLERGLIEPAGKLDAPGRPTLYRTGDVFLRTMGITSLDQLPPLPDLGTDEGIITLQNKIDALKGGELEGQLQIDADA